MFKKLLIFIILIIKLNAYEDIYFIDIHSQIDHTIDDINIINNNMVDNNVKFTFLSKRGEGKKLNKKIYKWSKENKNIYPLISTKKELDLNVSFEKFKNKIDKRLSKKEYIGFAEIIIYHGRKNDDFNIKYISINDKKIQYIIKESRIRNWPVILHIEFAASDFYKNKYMKELKETLIKYDDVSFVLQSFGQLNSTEIEELINNHDNIYFTTANTVPKMQHILTNKKKSWVNFFNVNKLKYNWKKVLLKYPDRILFAMDRVWKRDWSEQNYKLFLKTWKDALLDFPSEKAALISHKNAEKLWKIPIY